MVEWKQRNLPGSLFYGQEQIWVDGFAERVGRLVRRRTRVVAPASLATPDKTEELPRSLQTFVPATVKVSSRVGTRISKNTLFL